MVSGATASLARWKREAARAVLVASSNDAQVVVAGRRLWSCFAARCLRWRVPIRRCDLAGGTGGTSAPPAGVGESPDHLGGTGGVVGAAPERWFLLNDFEGGGDWLFGISVAGQFAITLPTSTTTPAREGSMLAVHLNAPGSDGMDVITHHHFDLTERLSGIRFWARRGATGPAELLIAVTGLDQVGRSHAADRADGESWRVHRVPRAEEWQQAMVRWADQRMPYSSYTRHGSMARASSRGTTTTTTMPRNAEPKNSTRERTTAST